MTQNGTDEVVKMLQLLRSLSEGQTLQGHARVSAQGATSRFTFPRMEALSARMTKKRFNQLEAVLSTVQIHLGGLSTLARSIKAILSPSATCALWLPTKDWSNGTDRASRNSYMTAKTKEEVLRFHHIEREPSVFEVLLEISDGVPQRAVLDGTAQWLTGLPSDLDKLQLFGCCDVVEPVFIPELKKSVLMPERYQVMMRVKPPAYPELGDRFEALHGLMFGSKRLCKGISVALGKEAKLIIASDVTDRAVVRLSPTCNKEAARDRAADWLVIGSDKLA